MRYVWLLLCAGLAWSQGTDPKRSAEQYEAHGQTQGVSVGAEFMVHSFGRGDALFVARDFLVVEVALFPPKGTTLTVSNGNFSLRINGKKQLLRPQSGSMVVAAMQHPEWNGERPSLAGSVGNVGVVLGGSQRRPETFPGSNPPGSGPPARVPVPRDNPAGIEKDPVKADEVLAETALVEGEHPGPCSGFLYFPFKGNTKSLKTLDLIYGDVELKLR